MPNLWVIFTTGLLTGGVTCMAVQGGLLASAISQNENKVFGTGSFLVSKLVAYTILGGLLGLLGSAVSLSIAGRGIMLGAAAVYMLGVAGAMLDIHPIFRYFLIQPPKFLRKIIRDQARSSSFFGPAVLGAMTVFIPCGTTQAMMALAIASGKPVYGALILGTFVLGTSPLFMGLGVMIEKLGEVFRHKFVRIAAYLVLGVAVWNLNSAAVLLRSPVTIQGVLAGAECAISFCETVGAVSDKVTVEINRSGYSVSNAVKAGQDVKMTLVNTDGRGCQQAVNIPALGISKIVRPGQSEEISFRAPDKPGELRVLCSMGMFTGKIQVI